MYKFENILEKGRWLHVIIAHNKMLEKALRYFLIIQRNTIKNTMKLCRRFFLHKINKNQTNKQKSGGNYHLRLRGRLQLYITLIIKLSFIRNTRCFKERCLLEMQTNQRVDSKKKFGNDLNFTRDCESQRLVFNS